MRKIAKFIRTNFVLILSVLYIISPIDFIPEGLLGPIGVIDDAGIVALMFIQLLWNILRGKKIQA